MLSAASRQQSIITPHFKTIKSMGTQSRASATGRGHWMWEWRLHQSVTSNNTWYLPGATLHKVHDRAPLFKKTNNPPNNLAEVVKENLLVTDRNFKQNMASENMTKLLIVTKAMSIKTYCGNLIINICYLKVKNVLTSPVASFCFLD